MPLSSIGLVAHRNILNIFSLASALRMLWRILSLLESSCSAASCSWLDKKILLCSQACLRTALRKEAACLGLDRSAGLDKSSSSGGGFTGIWSRGDLDEFSHFRYLMDKSTHVAQAVSTSGIRGFHAHLCRSACWIPMLQYSLSATWLSEAQCSQIQQPATRVFLTLMGINRSLPTAIVYGPTHFGCLGL